MLVEAIDAKYINMKNAQVSVEKYTDGTLGLIAQDEDEEGYPNEEHFSVNLAAYGLTPDDGCVFIKDYSEHEGLAKALEGLGLGTIARTFQFGPFSSNAHEFKLTDALIGEAR